MRLLPQSGRHKEAFERLHFKTQEKRIERLIPWDRSEIFKTRVREVTDLPEAVKKVDLIVEAVLENLGLNQEVFKLRQFSQITP